MREVVIDNVFGPVRVTTGTAGKVTLELRQHASARREDALEEAFREVRLSVETEGERLDAPPGRAFSLRALLREIAAATGTPTTR